MSLGEFTAAALFPGVPLLTLGQVAHFLSASELHILNLCEEGAIAARDIRGGRWKRIDAGGAKVPSRRCRITPKALDDFLAQRRSGQPQQPR